MSAREVKLPFGKYRGETLEEIYVEDPSYLEWLREELTMKTDTQSNLLRSNIENCFKEMRNARIY